MSPQENYWAALLALDFVLACWFIAGLLWSAVRKTVEGPQEIAPPGFSVGHTVWGHSILANHPIFPRVDEFIVDSVQAVARIEFLRARGYEVKWEICERACWNK